MSMHTVAVMGLGVRGKIHLHGLLENPDYYKVVGLCDIDEPKMKAVAEEYHLDDVPLFTDAEEMLKETRPEIFVFVTYPDLRLSVIQLAVKYGVKGISFEKPMAESLQEAKKIVKLCHDNGIKAVVCHQQKYLSQMQTLKKRIEDGDWRDHKDTCRVSGLVQPAWNTLCRLYSLGEWRTSCKMGMWTCTRSDLSG